MKQYLDTVRDVLANGVRQVNRTGVNTLFVAGVSMKFDLRAGFPLVTSRQIYSRPLVGEFVGFLRGCTSADDFRALGCNFWDANANKDGVRPNPWLRNPYRKGVDDLGRIYGAQWRDWKCADGSSIDQLSAAITDLCSPTPSRRVIINGWRPDELDQMALPPCHVLYHFIPDTTNNLLHLCMYQRSADMCLGVPFNIASCALFLELMARICHYKAATFTHFIGDAHVYETHLDGLYEQLERTPRSLPDLYLGVPALYEFNPRKTESKPLISIGELLRAVDPASFTISGYTPHAPIPFEMVV